MLRRLLPLILASIVALLGLPRVAMSQAGGAPADPPPTGSPARLRDIADAFDRRDFSGALRMLESRAAQNPKDPFTAYNLACAHAMLGQVDRAAESLLDAVSWGFTDLSHASQDPHLAPLRSHQSYKKIMLGWRELLDARGEADLAAARDALGNGYTYERDPVLRLSYASAMPAEAFEDAKRQIARVAAWTEHALGITASPDAARPDPWVLVVLPTPTDFIRLAGQPGIGGFYDRDRKRLVAQDIGPSLRHEFFHVLHWRHMDRLGQRHPYWIMEGLACLLEDVDDAPGVQGGFALAPSWRTNIAKRLARNNRLTPWSRLMTMPRDAFMSSTSRAHYAQSRTFFMFLHDQHTLKAWYERYTATFEEDETGAQAIAFVFDEPAAAVEARHRAWVKELPWVAEIAKPGDAHLGVEIGPGSGDGPAVTAYLATNLPRCPGPERLKLRDVITAIEGRVVRTLDDFHRVLGEHEPGEVVTLTVRRGSRPYEVRVELIARKDAPALP